MTDEILIEQAKKIYGRMCSVLDGRGWVYTKHDDRLALTLTVNGDDIPMNLAIFVSEKQQIVKVLSPLPFKMPEDKRMEGAIATCAASYGMLDGNFDYDMTDGGIIFRVTASYRNSEIGDELLLYLIDLSCSMVDNYNDRFLALAKGMISISDFISKG